MPSSSSSLWSEDSSEMGTSVWTWSRTEALEEPSLFTEVHTIFTSWCSTPAALRKLFRFEHQSHRACIETFCDACECESVSANPELFGANRPPGKSDPHLWLWVPSLKKPSYNEPQSCRGGWAPALCRSRGPGFPGSRRRSRSPSPSLQAEGETVQLGGKWRIFVFMRWKALPL